MFKRLVDCGDNSYTFEFKLCDDAVDRDDEAFTVDALGDMKLLFVGKTGFLDVDDVQYRPRIVSTELRLEEGILSLWATASIYPLSEDAADALDAYLDTHREFSISCCVRHRTCSICGAELWTNPCYHQKGHLYKVKGIKGKQKCYYQLSGVTDVYEWAAVHPCDNEEVC